MSVAQRRYQVRQGPCHGPSPIPEEGQWVEVKQVEHLSGLVHGCGTCAPQMGACKLTLNVKQGIVKEVLLEHIGCSGMTQSAAMAAEILPGKTVLEALNTDLVCDATNSAMKELFTQLAYGRTQTSFTDNGLPIGAVWEDLGAGNRSQIGTSYGNVEIGPRYLEIAEGYVTRLALDGNDEVIGYEFVNLGKMMSSIAEGTAAEEALDNAKGTYGRFDEAVRIINPRTE